MAYTIVQINFEFDSSLGELKEAAQASTNPIAELTGLMWKVYILNEEGRESGGIYLFQDAQSAQAYVAGDIVAGIKKHFSNVSIKLFDVMEAPSAMTYAPLAPVKKNASNTDGS